MNWAGRGAGAIAAATMMMAGGAGAQPAPGVAAPLRPVVYEMETLRTGPLPPEFIKRLEPLHTLQAVEDLLKANRIAFGWNHADVSSATLPTTFTTRVDAMPPGEVFVVPQTNGWLMGVVRARR